MHPLVKFTDFNKLSLLNEAYHKTGKYECYVAINALNSKLKGFIANEPENCHIFSVANEWL